MKTHFALRLELDVLPLDLAHKILRFVPNLIMHFVVWKLEFCDKG